MNAEKLLTYVGWLLGDEERFGIQSALDTLNSSLENLAAQPQIPGYQIEVASSLNALETAMGELLETYDAVQSKAVLSIGAEPFFTNKLIQGIKSSINSNAMTPTIAHQYVSELVASRSRYIKHLKSVQVSLRALSIEPEQLDEGLAEIGFQLPRDLFHNDLDGLVKELRAIRRIINAFSESVSGSAEPIEVRQISTSDPTFYFGLSPVVIAQLGAAVTWALLQWKTIEGIRKVRAETQNLKVFGNGEVKDFFDKKIKETVDKAVEEKTTEILGSTEGQIGRRLEQRTDMTWALESILARVEHGMTVEIRFLAPVRELDEGQTLSEKQKQDDKTFDQLNDVTKELVFPPPEPHPILELPDLPPKDNTVVKKRNVARVRRTRPKPSDDS